MRERRTKHPVVIACRSIRPELEALRPEEVEVRYLDQNLHRTPDLMPDIIRREIRKVESYATRIILGYGLCSNGIMGLRAPSQGLIVPRVHDCIALFLGSHRAYIKAFKKRPGTYYLTPGWIEEKKDPIGFLENDYVPRVGRDDAVWALREEMKHYTHICLIDTRTTDPAPMRERAMENVRFLNKAYEEVRGSTEYFRKILAGPYNDKDFLILRPGREVQLKQFLEGLDAE